TSAIFLSAAFTGVSTATNASATATSIFTADLELFARKINDKPTECYIITYQLLLSLPLLLPTRRSGALITTGPSIRRIRWLVSLGSALTPARATSGGF